MGDMVCVGVWMGWGCGVEVECDVSWECEGIGGWGWVGGNGGRLVVRRGCGSGGRLVVIRGCRLMVGGGGGLVVVNHVTFL